MKNKFLEQFYFDFFAKNYIAIAIFMTAFFPILGFLYEYVLLKEFGISIVMFSSSSDFLLSAFKKAIIPIAYVLIFTAFVVAGCLEATLLKKKSIKLGIVLNVVLPLITLILLLSLIIYKAKEHSENIKSKKFFYVSIELKKPLKLSNHSKDLVMISASGDYIFLYQRNGKSHIIPKNQIISLSQVPYTH